MSPYYLLECLVPPGETRLAVGVYPSLDGIDSWSLGARFDRPPTAPIGLQWDPDSDGSKKALYDATIPLLRQDLVDALRAVGVDNLDCYPARIVHPVSGEADDDYLAVNVIGAIMAADLSRSTYADPSGRRRIDMDFDSLAVAAKATRGALLFRLAECTSGLLVHSRVKDGIEAAGGFGLNFVAPEAWIG